MQLLRKLQNYILNKFQKCVFLLKVLNQKDYNLHDIIKANLSKMQFRNKI